MQRLRIEQWSLGRIAREVDGRLLSLSTEPGNPVSVSTDTRAISGGELFFALRGDRFDGHEFIETALDAGACAVVIDDVNALPGDRDCIAIVVDDCLQALGRLGYGLWREARQDGLHTVAVTGSNGKTTTKEFLATLWGMHGSVWATPGNFNNHIGVPLTLCALPEECDHLIVEMGANHIGEIEELIKLAPADERIITSIGRAHLEGFGSVAGVRRAKSEIFTSSTRATAAIVPFAEKEELIPRDFHGSSFAFGADDNADVRVHTGRPIEVNGRPGMEVHIEVDSRAWTCALPFLGTHNASNLAAAMTTLLYRGLYPDDDELNEALGGIILPQGRLRTVTVDSLRILDDAYNANPSSMRASFQAFEAWCGGKDLGIKVAVIGDMLELGDRSETEHRDLAHWLSARDSVDALLFVGEFAQIMAETLEGRRTACEVLAFATLDDVVQWLRQKESAQVYLKGSRGNRLEEIVEMLKTSAETVY